jgi:hypothetical protein
MFEQGTSRQDTYISRHLSQVYVRFVSVHQRVDIRHHNRFQKKKKKKNSFVTIDEWYRMNYI